MSHVAFGIDDEAIAALVRTEAIVVLAHELVACLARVNHHSANGVFNGVHKITSEERLSYDGGTRGDQPVMR